MNLRNLAFTNIAINNNDGWMCNMFFSGLFHINLDLLEIDFVTLLPAPRELGTVQYGPIGYYKEELYILPQNSDRILVYELKNSVTKEIFISKDIVGENIQLFGDVIFYRDKCYAIPRRSRAILEIDLNSKEINYYSDYYEMIKPYISKTDDFVISGSCLKGDEILLSSLQSNHVIRFNLITKEVQLTEVPNMGKLGSISLYCDGYCVTERDGMNVSIWNGAEFKYKTYNRCDLKSLSGIHKIYRNNKTDYIFPYNANMIMVAEDGEESVERLCRLEHSYREGLEYAQVGNQNMQCCEKYNEFIVCYSCFDAKIMKINMNTKEIQYVDALIDHKTLNRIHIGIGNKKNAEALYEEPCCNINDYLSILTHI